MKKSTSQKILQIHIWIDSDFYADSEYDLNFYSSPKTFTEIDEIPVRKPKEVMLETDMFRHAPSDKCF
jgi:hypothetical protein